MLQLIWDISKIILFFLFLYYNNFTTFYVIKNVNK